MQFIVKQQKGQDSVVTVSEGFIRDHNPRDRKTLIFETDQSLTSNSERAWNVEHAIKEHAHSRGYELHSSGKYKQVFVYSLEFHSRQIQCSIRGKVLAHPHYQAAKEEAKAKRDEINRKYGSALTCLKRLIHQLTEANRDELKLVAKELIDVQVQVTQEIGIPEQVLPHHRQFLIEPHHPYTPIEREQFKDYPFNLDDGLNWILNLLN